MAEVRREKDSLGFVEVPADVYYGAQTARAVTNFPISGLPASPFLIRALVMLWRLRRLPVAPVRYTGTDIRVEADEPLSVHVDGRIVGTLPITIRCRHAALRVFL